MPYRIGHVSDPCGLPPPEIYSWNNRFDDPKRGYRTLYCSDQARTCLREVLADLRPDRKAIAEFGGLFGASSEGGFGTVPREWAEKHALVRAKVVPRGARLARVEAGPARALLLRAHASALHALGHGKISAALLRSRNRPLTQAFSRTFYEAGFDGVTFRSRLDRRTCRALFEGRAALHAQGRPRPLLGKPRLFLEVCREFSLEIRF